MLSIEVRISVEVSAVSLLHQLAHPHPTRPAPSSSQGVGGFFSTKPPLNMEWLGGCMTADEFVAGACMRKEQA